MNNNNLYSKYRYDNNLTIKVRADINGNIVDVFGVSMRPLSDDIRIKLYGTKVSNYGITTIVNNIYKVERITNVDTTILSPTYKGPTYLKPF